MSPVISIITPVYNVERQLEKCLNSILCQTFSDFELILINDGSSDKSGEICDLYKEKDKRIQVIHQQNKGSSEARNRGLSLAKGTYLGFIDSDDWVEPDYLQNMLDCIVTNQADMVISAYYFDNNNNSRFLENKPSTLDKEAILNGFYSNQLHAGLWNKLVTRKIIDDNHLTFSKYNYYEDMVFSTQITIAATSFAYCCNPSYHYVLNSLSLTRDINENKRFRMFQDFIFNIQYILNMPYIQSNRELQNKIRFLINYNKKGLIYKISNQLLLNKAMSYIPNSVSFGEIQKISDYLLLVASKFHYYRPLKYYMTIRNRIVKNRK
jgi:glycosyltransferase involved in cell wall biosynthesis